MDPISATASVITLLGTAGASCKFLHGIVLIIVDAPQDIKRHNETLDCLHTTIVNLCQIYDNLPQSYQAKTPLHEWSLKFCAEVSAVRSEVELRANVLAQRGCLPRLRESFRWKLFDRQLRKFYESLDHWNIVFSQACAALQISLLMDFRQDLAELVETSRSTTLPPILAPNCALAQRNNRPVTGDLEPRPTSSRNLDNPPFKDDAGTKLVVLGYGARLAHVLKSLDDPIGVKAWCRLLHKLGYLSFGIDLGIPLRKEWTDLERLMYRVKPFSDGFGMVLYLQDTRWFSRRFVMQSFAFFRSGPSSGLNIRFNLRSPRIFTKEGFWYRAIKEADVVSLRQALASGKVSISDVTVLGDTLLHIAAWLSQREIIDFLIKSGADVNATNDWGQTALHLSMLQPQSNDCTMLLLSAGASALHQDFAGRTPLHTFYHKHFDSVLEKCTDDIDPWDQDDRGMTILHFLCNSSKSSIRTISWLQPKPNVSSVSNIPLDHSHLELKDWSGRSVLHFATQRGNLDLMRYFLGHPRVSELKKSDYHGRTLLHYAIESSRVQSIDLLLEHGFDLNVKDKHARTPMHHAVMRDNLLAVERLLELGASAQLNSKDADGNTPFELAKEFQSMSVVEYLRTISPEKMEKEFKEIGMAKDPPEITYTPCDMQKVERSRKVCSVKIVSAYVLTILVVLLMYRIGNGAIGI